MVLLLKEDIPVTLLSMKGKFSFMPLHTLPLVSFTYKIRSYGMGPVPPLFKINCFCRMYEAIAHIRIVFTSRPLKLMHLQNKKSKFILLGLCANSFDHLFCGGVKWRLLLKNQKRKKLITWKL